MSRQPSQQRARGYSVLEVLIATTIFTVFAASLFQLLLTLQAAQDRQGRQLTGLQATRAPLRQMLGELRLVGYPARNNFASPPAPGLIADGFLEATTNSLVFEADLDADGEVERIEYRVSADGRSLRRQLFRKQADGTLFGPLSSQDSFVQNLANQSLANPLPVFTWDVDPGSAAPFPNNISITYVALAIGVSLDPRNPEKKKILHLAGAARRINPSQ